MLYTHISEQKRFFCLHFCNFFRFLTFFFSNTPEKIAGLIHGKYIPQRSGGRP